MNANRRAQRLLDMVDRIERNARPARSKDDRRHDHMQTIETSRGEKARKRVGAALDQNATHAELGETAENCGGRDLPVRRGEPQSFRAAMIAAHALSRDDETANPVVIEKSRACRKPSFWVDCDARGVRPGDPADGQLRIIGKRGSNPDDDRVDKGAQAMQMSKARRSVDVMRTPRRGRNAPIERLADLAGDDEVIDGAFAKRPEQRLPRRRQRRARRPKSLGDRSPRFAQRISGGRISAVAWIEERERRKIQMMQPACLAASFRASPGLREREPWSSGGDERGDRLTYNGTRRSGKRADIDLAPFRHLVEAAIDRHSYLITARDRYGRSWRSSTAALGKSGETPCDVWLS